MTNPNATYKGMLPIKGGIVMGLVIGFDRTEYTVDVLVLPQMWRLVNVRQATAFAGGALNIVSDLAINDVVLIALVNNSIDEPIVIGRVWHHGTTVPTYSEDESLITHKSGTTIKIGDTGDVTITAASGKKVYVNSSEVVLDGNSTAGHSHPYTWTGDPGSGNTSPATDTIVANQA
jgi:uncharacterized protein involved in type VI secretion and phage assembly